MSVKKPNAGLRDRGDLPTIRPNENPAAVAASLMADESPDHTLANAQVGGLPGSEQFEDLPTPVKGPSLRDMGVATDSEFAEDTNKGDGPRGMPQPTSGGGDASVELSDDDFEAFE